MALKNGYVRLWRKSLHSAVWKNPTLWRVWTWCLMKATYKECEHLVGRMLVRLLPGQFVYGRRAAADEMGISESASRWAIKTLIKLGNLTSTATNKYSILTICKWQTYQASAPADAPTDDPTDDPTTAPADAPQRKKGKEVLEKGKEEKHEGAPPALSDTWNEMAAFPQLPKVTVMTAKRKATLRVRWAEAFFRENWAEAMAKIPGCPFLIGQSERGWRADFDWFLKPDTVAKILEGKYDAGAGAGGKSSARSPRRFALADTQPDKFKGR